MTAYQEKRRFLNKINARIRTLVNKAGVERSDIKALINLDGVWFTDTGNLNMTTEAFTQHKEGLMREIQSAIPSYYELREDIRSDIQFKASPHIGGEANTSLENLHNEMREHFSYRRQFEEFTSKFYDAEEAALGIRIKSSDIDKIDATGMTDEERSVILGPDIRDSLKKIGSDWRSGNFTPTELMERLKAIQGKAPKSWGE